MADPLPDFAALIGSRICHDLISPLGAIGNGVELLEMSEAGSGPEVALISESVANANARIRFFRVAFGAAGGGGSVSASEIRSILAAITAGSRTRIDWQVAGDVPRPEAKLAFLALQCLETALPWGGEITVTSAGGWQVAARAARLNLDEALWANLSAATPDPAIAPAQLQFALLPVEARAQGLSVSWSRSSDSVTIRF
ncbi:MAG: histidine phosphotransferase family protein [Albidovulum sp.]